MGEPARKRRLLSASGEKIEEQGSPLRHLRSNTRRRHFQTPFSVSPLPSSPPAPPNNVFNGGNGGGRRGKTVQETLYNYFGFSAFRPGQLPCIDGIVNDRRDTCVFWSTGSGKSMVYTIPPLHTGKPAIGERRL